MSKPNSLSLKSQIDSYTAASKPPKNSSEWTKRWPLYAAAAGSALACTTNAQAGIVYSGIQNFTETLPHSFTGASEGAGGQIMIDGATFAFGVAQFITGGVFHNGVAEVNGLFSNRVGENGNLARRLSSGAKISAGAGIYGGYGQLHHQSSTNARGNFAPGQTGIVGLAIGTGANQHFGWIRLDFHNSAGGYPISITAIDWAYNTIAGQSINAGQQSLPSSTPEPGTTSLALLAAGSAGVLAWRKSRKQNAA